MAPSEDLPLDILYAYVPDRIDIFPGQLRLASADGKKTQSLLSLPDAVIAPRWSPDGARILFHRSLTPTQRFPLWIVQSDGTGLRALPTELDQVRHADWSPDGQWIAYHRVTIYDKTEIAAMRPDGSDQRTIVTGLDDIFDGPSWSRDGRIAFRRNGAAPGIWTVNADGSGLTRLTSGQNDDSPLWSPDGKQLAFRDVLNPDQQRWRYAINVVNADGTARRMLTAPDENTTDSIFDWSPDGSKILFSRWWMSQPPEPPHNSVLSIPLAGGPVVAVLPIQPLAKFNGASWRR
jgi:TolB protein